ncbi:ABC transporter substrate-binding protein [Streptomonospora nanhaiensis]|uniref:Iron complex transport system substrate-binding protein n=1 Tax=Streptomonospora nanhaiensis TaxID=1323731 RepID=A0A853BVE6_9ACTN|nr:ABC transporter substrate-binding protein [Streptomonospora nanhaiensis]MBV2365567.1 ABC transporter substrate-binding protein [Streptomonospora nanhaiensis]MBX9387121.1 ABC transporter substrate-binding protein [Streptomonospora nanhaiensis]NYI98940.1 iron complex transport system substrate-binding protein [Streptomonospora nanhaiensis]
MRPSPPSPHPARPGRAARSAAAAAGVVLALSACGTAAGAGGGAPAEGYPVTVRECGREVTVSAPPQRAVAMNQHVAEIMLALGLADRMVGTAFLDDAVLPELREDYASVPVLAERYPSYEALLAAEPDFVYAGFAASAFDPAEGRGRDALEAAGMTTYASVEQCATDVDLDTVGTEIRNIGRLFGVEERADELVADIEAEVASVEARLAGTDPVDVLVVDSLDATVFTSGGAGIADDMIASAGGRNVFSDVDDVFADVSIEQAAARDPEAILFYDYGSTTVEDKRRAVLAQPALAHAPAVRRERFAELPLSSTVVGVRVGDAVTRIAEQLHPEAF